MAIDWGSYYDPKSQEAENRAAEAAGASDWQKWRAYPEENVGRVCPPGPQDKATFDIVEEHRFKVPGSQYPIRFVCIGPGCPACAQVVRLESSGHPADKDAAKELAKKPRVYFRWLDRSFEDRGPVKASLSLKTYGQMREIREDRRRGGDFVNPKTGFDLCVLRYPAKSEKNDTSYDAYKVIRDKDCVLGTQQQMDAWMPAMPPLKSLAPYKSAQEVVQLVTGRSSEVRGEIESGRGRSIQTDAENDAARNFLE
jgi:hypothetical protein